MSCEYQPNEVQRLQQEVHAAILAGRLDEARATLAQLIARQQAAAADAGRPPPNDHTRSVLSTAGPDATEPLPADPPEGLALRRDQPPGERQLAIPRLLLLIVCSIVVTVGLLLGASLAMAQVPPLVGRGPYEPDRVGIPMGPQVIDVRWSGDHMGEFTEIGVLPPAFRGPAPAPIFAPVLVPPPGAVPAPVPAPPPPPVPGLVPAPVPSTVPTPVRIPTIVLPNR